jgi:hypothetical protein
MMMRSAREKIESQIEKIREVNLGLKSGKHINIIRANEGRIRKLEGHLSMLLGTYEKMREIKSDPPKEVTAGVIFAE